jgi:hypothetical protein
MKIKERVTKNVFQFNHEKSMRKKKKESEKNCSELKGLYRMSKIAFIGIGFYKSFIDKKRYISSCVFILLRIIFFSYLNIETFLSPPKDIWLFSYYWNTIFRFWNKNILKVYNITFYANQIFIYSFILDIISNKNVTRFLTWE